MTAALVILLVSLVSASAGQTPAAPVTVSPKVASEYAKLTAKVEREQGHKRAEALANLAEYDFVYADAAFRAGQTDTMLHRLDTMQQHIAAAMNLIQAEAALGKRDGMKRVEQSLQRIGFNLKDLAQQVNFRTRPQVQTVAEHVANQRAQVLDWMFAPKKLLPAVWRPQSLHDPLTAVEADQLRDTSDALDKRVTLLTQFAGERLTRFEAVRTAARPAPDRLQQLYGLLRQYTAILPELNDAMDDLAAAKKPDGKPQYNAAKAMQKVIEAENGFLTTLEHVQSTSAPADLASYHYELQNCLDATRDSLQNAKQDGGSATDVSRRAPRAQAAYTAA